jgi:YidC/Oxa1 family membrane protein insertase
VNLNFLYTPVSWVLLQWHHLLNAIGVNPNGGLNWTLSIVLLVITARLLLFRLFVKQVKYQRHMQKMQPQIQELRKKYKDDRAAMQREMMKLQQDQGFNPLAGCLPMFAQIPIFIALYHVLRHLSNSVSLCKNGHLGASVLQLYTFKPTETCQAAQARLFGGAPLAGRLTDTASQIHQLSGMVATTRVVIIVLVLISASATFMTQRLVRAGQATVPEGTAATVQRLMMYLVPLGTLFSGTFFPLGVLLYWFTSNVWTMLQQLYINKYHPHDKDEGPQTRTIGRALAPKPGQRPVRDPRGRVALTTPTESGVAADADTVEAGAEEPGGDGATPPAAPTSTPRPGQRPIRPGASGGTTRTGGSNRSSAKRRPTQAKKRR